MKQTHQYLLLIVQKEKILLLFETTRNLTLFKKNVLLEKSSKNETNLHVSRTKVIETHHWLCSLNTKQQNIYNTNLSPKLYDLLHNQTINLHPDRISTLPTSCLAMGASTHKTDKPQQSNPPLSPVSPLESNGENWKYPPIANRYLKGQETFSKVPLEEVRSKKRLSRPFEQPYPITTSGGQRQDISRSMQANMKRADSYVGQQPALVPKRKPAPARLTTPPPTYQARYESDQNPFQESQASAERSDRWQKTDTRGQRSARHQGWDPFKQPRFEITAITNNKDYSRADGHNRDLERQDEAWPYSKPRECKRPDDAEGRRCGISLLIMLVLGIVAVVVTVKLRLG